MPAYSIIQCIHYSIICCNFPLLLLIFSARRVNYIKTSEVIQLPYPVQMRCTGLHSYFMKRDTWGWSDFFMNPMVSLYFLVRMQHKVMRGIGTYVEIQPTVAHSLGPGGLLYYSYFKLLQSCMNSLHRTYICRLAFKLSTTLGQ